MGTIASVRPINYFRLPCALHETLYRSSQDERLLVIPIGTFWTVRLCSYLSGATGAEKIAIKRTGISGLLLSLPRKAWALF